MATLADHITNMKTDKEGKPTLTGKIITFTMWTFVVIPTFIALVLDKLGY